MTENTTVGSGNDAVTRELTFGEKAVGLTFNPSSSLRVDGIKRKCADAIDLLNEMRSEEKEGSEEARMFSQAITELQSAQMWGVKAVTWNY